MDELKPVRGQRDPGYPSRKRPKGLRRGLIAAGAVALALGACGLVAASRAPGAPADGGDPARMAGEAPAVLHVEKPSWYDFGWAVSAWQQVTPDKPVVWYPPPEQIRTAGVARSPAF